MSPAEIDTGISLDNAFCETTAGVFDMRLRLAFTFLIIENGETAS